MVRRYEFGLEMLVHHRAGTLAFKRHRPRHHVVQRGPKRVNIRRRTDVLLTTNLLRRDVVRRTKRTTRLRFRRFNIRNSASQTHIRELHDTLFGNHDVLGFHIPVNQPTSMRMLERFSDLDNNLNRKLLVKPFVLNDVLVNRPPFDILHHEVVDIPLVPNIKRLHDVGVIERRRRASFSEEPLNKLWILRELLGKLLERNHPVERHLLRFVHRRHRASAEFAQNLVPADLAPRPLRFDRFAQSSKLTLGDELAVYKHMRQRLVRRALTLGAGHGFAVLDFLARRKPLVDDQTPDQCVKIRSGFRCRHNRLFGIFHCRGISRAGIKIRRIVRRNRSRFLPTQRRVIEQARDRVVVLVLRHESNQPNSAPP